MNAFVSVTDVYGIFMDNLIPHTNGLGHKKMLSVESIVLNYISNELIKIFRYTQNNWFKEFKVTYVSVNSPPFLQSWKTKNNDRILTNIL